MMPHPERAAEAVLGNTDGKSHFRKPATTSRSNFIKYFLTYSRLSGENINSSKTMIKVHFLAFMLFALFQSNTFASIFSCRVDI